MNKQKLIVFATAIALMGGGVAVLAHLRSHQKLGLPAVKTTPIAGSANLQILLPEHVLDYDSVAVEIPEIVTNTLPKDTSFGQRLYKAPDEFETVANVVLMGKDRTSLHK